MTLHLLSNPHRLDDCLQACQEMDAVVLLDAAAQLPQATSLARMLPHPCFRLIPPAHTGKASASVQALSETEQPTGINHLQLVELCCQHNPIVSWY